MSCKAGSEHTINLFSGSYEVCFPNAVFLAVSLNDIFQCFTILWQEPGIQALQVLNAQGKWIDAPPIPGTLVVKYAFFTVILRFDSHILL